MHILDPAVTAAFYEQIAHDIIHGINDWTVYSMYADALEECGLVEPVIALRWQAAHQKHPLAVGGLPPYFWCHAFEYPGRSDPASNLPTEIYEYLFKTRERYPGPFCVRFGTVKEAEEAFITAFMLAVILAGFNPDKLA